jgi:hypothetical protein
MKKLLILLALLPMFAMAQNNGEGIWYAPSGITNTVQVGGTVGVVLKGTATQWNDQVTTSIQTRVTPATLKPEFSTDSLALLFVRDADSNEIAYFQIQMSHSITYGTDRTCNPHFHYVQYAAGDTTFTPALWYRIHKLGGRSGNWTRLKPTARAQLTFTSAPFHNICEFPDITLNNVSESSFIEFKLYRYDSGGNPATLYFKGFDVHFEYDKIGTVDEYPSH